MATCEHLEGLSTAAEPTSDLCDRCIASGDSWVHLRACLMCGMVGCCDASKNQHARQHWIEDGHPLERSIEPGETWRYCFEDGVGIR